MQKKHLTYEEQCTILNILGTIQAKDSAMKYLEC